MKKIGPADLIWSGIKLNFLHASWNFERLQNIGFLCAINNLLKKIYEKGSVELQRAVRRNIGFFNTHIFFSGAALGVVAKLEEELPNTDQDQKDREIENTKMGIMGPLAAIGDSLFWTGIKPIALLTGAGILMMTGYSPDYWAAAALTAFIIYNLPRVVIKYYLLFKAYYDYRQLFSLIQRIRFQDIMKAVKTFGMLLLGGIMAAYFATRQLQYPNMPRRVDNLLLIIVFIGAAVALKRKASVSDIFIAAILLSIILSYTVF